MFHQKCVNQIFYKNNKFDNSESLKRLEKYFLCNDLLLEENMHILSEKKEITITQCTKIEEVKKEEIKNKPFILPSTEKTKFYIPKQKDSLFWCVYIFMYGKDEYDEIKHSYGNKVLEEKQKIIDFIQKNPKLLKSSNVKMTNNSIKELLSEFMVDRTTSYYGLATLSIYYKIPIYLINEEKKIYFKFLPEQEYIENKPCTIYLHNSESKIPTYKLYHVETEPNLESFLCLESIIKPIKTISYYKSEDLHTIANKIGFIPDKKMKKAELYEKISTLCVWDKL